MEREDSKDRPLHSWPSITRTPLMTKERAEALASLGYVVTSPATNVPSILNENPGNSQVNRQIQSSDAMFSLVDTEGIDQSLPSLQQTQFDKAHRDALEGKVSHVPCVKITESAALPAAYKPAQKGIFETICRGSNEPQSKWEPVNTLSRSFLSPEHAAALLALSQYKFGPHYKETSERKLKYLSQGRVMKWEERLEELRLYKALNGNCNVPQRFAENRKLGSWVNAQRTQYRLLKAGKSSSLNESRIKALNDLGFSWNLQSTSWEERLHELQEFKIIFGHCNVPKRFPDNPRLGLWVHWQRTQYRLMMEGKQSALTPGRVATLNCLGFLWRDKK